MTCIGQSKFCVSSGYAHQGVRTSRHTELTSFAPSHSSAVYFYRPGLLQVLGAFLLHSRAVTVHKTCSCRRSACAGDVRSPGTCFRPSLWRRSKLSTAGRGISGSGSSAHAACGGYKVCVSKAIPIRVIDFFAESGYTK